MFRPQGAMDRACPRSILAAVITLAACLAPASPAAAERSYRRHLQREQLRALAGDVRIYAIRFVLDRPTKLFRFTPG